MESTSLYESIEYRTKRQIWRERRLSGDTLAVGASREASVSTGINQDESNNDAIESGAVYLFTRSANEWSQQAYIKASNTNEDSEDNFGYSVALTTDTLAVGAVYEASDATGVNQDQSNNNAYDAGAVYVFE